MRAVVPVIDAHLHLDPQRFDSAAEAVSALSHEVAAAGIERGVVLHLSMQPWSPAELGAALSTTPNLVGFVNVHPRSPSAAQQLEDAHTQHGFVGLKLHPRLQEYDVAEAATVALVQHAGRLGMPVVIDAFPDGTAIRTGFDPVAFANLARACPGTAVVVAHFAGHRCIDLMMLMKRTPNLWADLSYSLLYYRGSSVVQDLLYASRSLRCERVLYGSDAPDRPVKESLVAARALFDEYGLDEGEQRRLLHLNARELLGWTDD